MGTKYQTPCRPDCPDRHGGCAADCKKPEYLAHLEARKARYEEREKEMAVKEYVYSKITPSTRKKMYEQKRRRRRTR